MNDKLSNFLRDFAVANSDSFEPDQVQNLVDAANLIEELSAYKEESRIINGDVADYIEKLIQERDEARVLHCEFVAWEDRPKKPQDVANELGWEGLSFDWDDVTTTQYWCDDCGDAIEVANVFFYAELPCDITSANKGESATVCRKCNERIEADYCNSKFRNSNMKE